MRLGSSKITLFLKIPNSILYSDCFLHSFVTYVSVHLIGSFDTGGPMWGD